MLFAALSACVSVSRRGFTAGAAATTAPNAFTASTAVSDATTLAEKSLLSAAEAYMVVTHSSPKFSPRAQRVRAETFILTCKGKRAVFLGEHHDALADHLLQAALIRAVRPSRGTMAVGLEAVQRRFQPALDAYITGELHDDELEAAIEWRTRWSWPFDVCMPLFHACRELTAAGMPTPLLALNVDSEDWRRVVVGGLSSLERATLSRYVNDVQGSGSFATTTAFQEYISYVLHPSYAIQPMRILRRTSTGQQLEIDIPFGNYLSGRLLWDEAMASAAASWCKAHPRGLLLGLVGSDHVKFGCGVAGRCARQLGGMGAVTTVLLNPTAADTTDAALVRSPTRGSDGRIEFTDYALQLPFTDLMSSAATDRAAAFAAAQTRSPSSAVLGLADFLLFSKL